ncbi:MAG: TolC family protein [Epsilonproteobacteria bacterium]|nr:TolC family protein [Campylobacterota bacterium]
MYKIKLGLYFHILLLSILSADSLEEVLKNSVQHHPKTKVALENYKASMYEFKKSNANYQPTLDISAEMGREHTEIASSFKGAKALNERQLRVVGNYNLFDGFSTTYKSDEKQFAVQVAKNRAYQTINQVAFLTIQAYLDVLRRKELLDIESKSLDNHLETLEKVKIRLQSGDGYESDYRQTRARVKLAEVNKLMVEKQYTHAQIHYRQFIQSVPNVTAMSSPLVSLDTNISKIEVLTEKIKKDNLQIKGKVLETQMAKSIYQQEQSAYYPTVDLELSQSWNNNVHGFEGQDDSYKLALIMNYNLYSGGANRASELSALQKIKMSEGSLDDVKLTVEENLQLSLMKYNILKEQLVLLNQQLEHLLETKKLYELEYQNSKRTVIDVLNIKQEFSYAQTQKTNAHYDQLLAYYQFKYVMGTLVQEFNLEGIINQNGNKT